MYCEKVTIRVARKKPHISKVNAQKHLKFAKELINKPEEIWNDVMYCDESKFNIYKSNDRTIVWRGNNILPTVKHGGKSVMVWRSMGANSVGNLHSIE